MLGGLVTIFAGHLIETAKLKAYAVALYAGAGACLLFASIFGLVALRHWIAVAYGSEYPDLWIALGFLVIAIPFIGGALYLQNRKSKTNALADIAIIAGPPALSLIARNTSARMAGVGAILVAGLVFGRRLTKRRAT